MEPLDTIAAEMQGYHAVSYLELHCREHGDIRAATESEPQRRYPCPLCGSACLCTKLGRGLTRRQPPFWEHATAASRPMGRTMSAAVRWTCGETGVNYPLPRCTPRRTKGPPVDKPCGPACIQARQTHARNAHLSCVRATRPAAHVITCLWYWRACGVVIIGKGPHVTDRRALFCSGQLPLYARWLRDMVPSLHRLVFVTSSPRLRRGFFSHWQTQYTRAHRIPRTVR